METLSIHRVNTMDYNSRPTTIIDSEINDIFEGFGYHIDGHYIGWVIEVEEMSDIIAKMKKVLSGFYESTIKRFESDLKLAQITNKVDITYYFIRS